MIKTSSLQTHVALYPGNAAVLKMYNYQRNHYYQLNTFMLCFFDRFNMCIGTYINRFGKQY